MTPNVECGQCGRPVDKRDATTGAIIGDTIICAECLRFELDLEGDEVDDPPLEATAGKRGGSPRFYELLEEMGFVHSAKNADYSKGVDPFRNFRGCERFGIPAWIGAYIRLQDKYERCTNLIGNWQETGILEGAVKDEAFKDTIIDLANYSLIVRCLYEEWVRSTDDKKVDDIAAAAGYKRNSAVIHDVADRVWQDPHLGPEADKLIERVINFLGPYTDFVMVDRGDGTFRVRTTGPDLTDGRPDKAS